MNDINVWFVNVLLCNDGALYTSSRRSDATPSGHAINDIEERRYTTINNAKHSTQACRVMYHINIFWSPIMEFVSSSRSSHSPRHKATVTIVLVRMYTYVVAGITAFIGKPWLLISCSIPSPTSCWDTSNAKRRDRPIRKTI